MANHALKISVSSLFGQSKTLLAEHPGRTGVLIDQGKETVKSFANSRAMLNWCEKHKAALYYIPPAPVSQN